MGSRVVARVRRVFQKMRKVRNPRQAWEFASWFGRAVGRLFVAGLGGRPVEGNAGDAGGASEQESPGRRNQGV